MGINSLFIRLLALLGLVSVAKELELFRSTDPESLAFCLYVNEGTFRIATGIDAFFDRMSGICIGCDIVVLRLRCGCILLCTSGRLDQGRNFKLINWMSLVGGFATLWLRDDFRFWKSMAAREVVIELIDAFRLTFGRGTNEKSGCEVDRLC